MLFSDLEKMVSGKSTLINDTDIHLFSTDSRTLSGREYEVFIAIQGKRDGHDFIEEAREKGVRNFILERTIELPDCNTFQVSNAIRAFQKIAAYHRRKFEIPIVGITGSNGKTTTKEWLSVVLSEQFFVVKNPKSFNSQIGVPLSILEMQDIHEIGVFEAGISQVDEMEHLEKIIQPTLGLFTTLGSAHSEGFENDQEKLSEKLLLFRHCERLVCRKDTTYFDQIQKEVQAEVVTWSLEGEADYQVSWQKGIIRVNNQDYHSSFTQETDLENATHTIICALNLGLSSDLIQKGLSLIKPVPMRLELKKGINGCFILDDTYNNDLQGLKVAINYLDTHKQNERKTLILSDILQSGKADGDLYGEVNELLVDHQITRLIGIGSKISNSSALFNVEKSFFESTEELLSDLPEFNQEMVIVKGARDFALERVVKRLEQRTHGTILEVNFEALQHNLNQYRNLLSPNTKIMVMVKANAYGSGILEVANFLQHQRVDRLGVAYVDEAILLRKHGIHIPIMIMNPDIGSFHDFDKYRLEAEIYSLNHLAHILSSMTNYPSIHLKIDTGMHRLGFSEEDIPKLQDVLSKNPEVKVTGIFTHFSGSESFEHDAFTAEQAMQFERIYTKLSDTLGYAPVKHASNSSAIVRWPQYHYDMVRLGIGLHGFDPTGKLSLRSTSRLVSTISQIRNLKNGDTIGYGRKGVVKRDSKIAILPIGYEDGFMRVFGNGNAQVLCDGKMCPTIGNVCMDMLMVDVTDIEAKEGDEVLIFGENPTIQDLADWSGTIPYEILTNVSDRVKRVFVWDG